MRKRRRHRSDSDSFDLFLDTITNTFGGILLVALLMVLLIRETGGPEFSSIPSPDPDELRERIAALESRKSSLEKRINTRSKIVPKNPTPELKDLAKQTEELLQIESALQADERSQSERLAKARDELNQLQTEQQKLEIEVNQQREELDDLQDHLTAEQKLRMRTMQLPKGRPTPKSMVLAIIKEGRLFFVDKNRGQSRFQIDDRFLESTSGASTADLVLEDQSAYRVKAGSGLPLDETVLQEELARINQDHFLAFAVWPDSFDGFFAVREACVRARFEYQIIPVEKGPVVESRSASRATPQ